MGKKRSKPGSSSSANEEEMAGQDLGTENDLYRELKESIECLKRLVTEGLARLHGDLDILRSEFKSDIKEMSCTMKDLEKSLNFTQDEVDTFKEQLKKETRTLFGNGTFNGENNYFGKVPERSSGTEYNP